jgi:hypothetical protein
MVDGESRELDRAHPVQMVSNLKERHQRDDIPAEFAGQGITAR